MVVREVGAARCEIDQEEIGDGNRVGDDAIARRFGGADEKFVENRVWMTFDGLFFEFAEIGDFQLGRVRERNVGGNFDGGDDEAERLVGRIGNRVRDGGREIGEIILREGMGFAGVVQSAGAVEDEVEFFDARIGDGLAGAFGIDREFTEAGDGVEDGGLRVAFAEDGSVVAGVGGDVDGVLGESGNIAIEPGGIDSAFLREERRG